MFVDESQVADARCPEAVAGKQRNASFHRPLRRNVM